MKKITLIAAAIIVFLSAFLSYKYLALALFSLGLSRFYDVAPTVPEQCTEVVADAAVAFTGIFDYISLAVAAALLILALYLTWRAFSLRTT